MPIIEEFTEHSPIRESVFVMEARGNRSEDSYVFVRLEYPCYIRPSDRDRAYQEMVEEMRLNLLMP
jgi:hypothetical protein